MLGPILFVLYTHPISEIVSYHSLSHHSFSDDDQLYKCGNITQLPEIIHSTQSCRSDVKAWMTNNQLQLNNDKTEMMLISTETVLNSDSVPQSINLEGSDIKFANTVRNLGVCCYYYYYSVLYVGEWGWRVEGKQVGSMDEESQVRGCYNITFICTPTNQETVSVLKKTQANKTFRT